MRHRAGRFLGPTRFEGPGLLPERGALWDVARPTLTHLWLCHAQLKDARSRRRRRLPTAMAADIDPERGRAAALAALANAAAAALVVAEAALIIADAAAALVVR